LLAFPGVVALAAWIGGVGAGLFTTLVSGALGLVLFVKPMAVVAGHRVDQAVLLMLFGAQGTLITFLTAALHASRQRIGEALAAEQRHRADAESAARLKEEFLGIVSHELRTPLNVVLGSTWRLKHSPDPGVRKAAAIIERNARAQALIVDNLLYVSETLAGHRAIARERLDLQSICHESLGTIEAEARAKEIELRFVPVDSRVFVSADPGALRQALTAVLANAVKFSPTGAYVELSLAVAPSQVEIIISDVGVGISADALSRVFEPFWQADSSARRTHGGLGLGLTAARQIAVLHGGLLSAHSEGEGKGATFRLTLPRDGEANAVDQPSMSAVGA